MRIISGILILAVTIMAAASSGGAGELPVSFRATDVTPPDNNGDCPPGQTKGMHSTTETSGGSTGGSGGFAWVFSGTVSGERNNSRSTTVTMPVCITTEPTK